MSTVMSAHPAHDFAAAADTPAGEARSRLHVTSGGRLRDDSVVSEDRNYALAAHLGPLVVLLFGGALLSVIPALVVWLVRKDKSVFVDDHGRESMNFQLSLALWSLLLFWTIVIPVVLWVVAIVSSVRGSIAAGNGEYFRYPLTVRFV